MNAKQNYIRVIFRNGLFGSPTKIQRLERQTMVRAESLFHTYNYWKHLFKEKPANQVLPHMVLLAIPEPVTIPESTIPNVPLSRQCAMLKDSDPKYIARIHIVCGFIDFTTESILLL